MAGDTTSDRFNRLSIQVPDYDTRLNMGTPDPGVPSGSASFGYTGFSVHTNFSFFMDIGRVGLYQSNQGSCWQVGGKWLQWSNLDMFMATTGNNTVAADNKVTVVAGAGQGQVTALTAGSSPFEQPRLVEYNNLQLHWRVDAVQVALKQFFYGYGDIDKAQRMLLMDPAIPVTKAGTGWRALTDTSKSEQENYSKADRHYPGGFLKDVDTFLVSVGQMANKADLLKPFEWEGDRLDMSGGIGSASYFSALEPFDPYPPTQYTNDGFKGILSKIYAALMQVLNWIRRTVDVLRRFAGALTTDNPLWGKRIVAFLQLWQDRQDLINSWESLKEQDIQRWYKKGIIKESDVFASHEPKNVENSEKSQHIGPTPATLGSLNVDQWTVTDGSSLTLTDDHHTLTVTFHAVPPATTTSVTAAALVAALNGTASPPQVTIAWATPPGAPPGNPALDPPQGWTATAADPGITILQNRPGKDSHLKMSGSGSVVPPTDGSLDQQMFGYYPKPEAWGQDATSPDDEALDTRRSRDIAFGSLPEDVRNQLRPLYTAAQDISTIISDAVSMGTDVMQGFLGTITPPSMVGLIGKDGITLGSNGPIYGAGGGITFVATGKSIPENPDDNPTESDRKKYVLGPENVVNWALDGDDAKWWGTDPPVKAFTPDSKIKKAMRGHFRVAAEGNAITTAQGKVMVVSLDETWVLSQKQVTIASNEQATLRSYTNTAEIVGTTVVLGEAAPADDSKQLPTWSIRAEATKLIHAVTDKLRLRLDEDAILLGKNDKDKSSVLTTKHHLAINLEDGMAFLAAGYHSDPNFFGLTVGDDDVVLHGKSSATLSVQDGGAVQVSSSAVTISKDLKVGSALIVRGDGTLASTKPKKIKDADPLAAKKAEYKGKYQANIAAAKAQNVTLDGIEEADNAPGATLLATMLRAVDKGTAQRQLRTLYRTHLQILAEARANEISKADLGWQVFDEPRFTRRAPNDPKEDPIPPNTPK